MARRKVDEDREGKINAAYAKAMEKVTGVKPASEDPKFKNFGKESNKSVKKAQNKSTGKNTAKAGVKRTTKK